MSATIWKNTGGDVTGPDAGSPRFEIWKRVGETPVRLEGVAPSFDAAVYYAKHLIAEYGCEMMIADRFLVTDTSVPYAAQAEAARVWPTLKRFTTDEDDHKRAFTLAEFREHNADDPDLRAMVRELEGLTLGESLVWNFGAGGQTTMKRVA